METTIAQPDYSKLTISQFVPLIKANWRATAKNGIYFGAVPYLQAMACVNALDDQYGCEDGRTQVLYFLSNAQTWKGEVAKAIKAELNKRLKAR
jgi:hypothetical protein